MQRTLLVAVVLAAIFSESAYIFFKRVTVPEAILHAAVAMAIGIGLLQFCFHIVYQLMSSEERRLRESRILLDIATALSSTSRLTQALEIIAKYTAEACQVHRCSILMWDEGQRRILPLMSQYASGAADQQLWERFRSGTYARMVDEVPILSQLIKGRRPLVLNRDALSSLPEAWTKPFDVLALLLIPLLSRDHVIGFMALDHIEPKGFAQDQIDLAMTIGGQAASALEKARLIEQLSQKARRLTLLAEISMAVTSTLELDAILNRAVAGLCAAFQVQQCGVIIFDQEHPVGRLVAEYPPRAEKPSVTIPLRDNPSIERILSTRQPVAVEDAQHDPLLAKLWETMRQREVQSILIVPILVKDSVIGTIGLDATDAPRTFTPEEVELAQTVANQIAVAIDNARLYQQRMDDINRLKEVDQLKSNLVSNVSHELRGPLTSIKAYTELLMAEADKANHSVCRDWLLVIERETDRLTALITDYLNLSRLEAGHFRLVPQPMGLAEVVAEVLAVLGVQAEQRHITVELEAQPALPELWADGELIRIAIRNLVSNAIKFSHDGGRIHIAVWHEGGTFKFSVQDEGIGIAKEMLPHLFDKFFRVPTAKDVPGTGLGLALAKEAVTAHGGRIEVESTPGKGSKFTVVIPAGEQDLKRIPDKSGWRQGHERQAPDHRR